MVILIGGLQQNFCTVRGSGLRPDLCSPLPSVATLKKSMEFRDTPTAGSRIGVVTTALKKTALEKRA